MTDDAQPTEPAEEAPMSEPGLVEPVAVGPGDPAANDGKGPRGDGLPLGDALPRGDGAALDPVPVLAGGAAPDPADASLLALVDKLTSILERSDLGELEVSAGATTIILRSPSAIERQVSVTSAPALDVGVHPSDGAPVAAPAAAAAGPGAAPASKPSVKAPLTGIFYGAPSPGATAYVSPGDHVSVGQIIGLIEAMKLFNEIKSDLAGRVVRVCADNGALVKAKQPLIEVEPA
jgi:acetyl-CoA carboxylase biotin carboxyl carrier protein